MGRGGAEEQGRKPLYGKAGEGPMAAARQRRGQKMTHRRHDPEQRRLDQIAADLDWQWRYSNVSAQRSFAPTAFGLADPRSRLLAWTQLQPQANGGHQANQRLRWEIYLVHDGQRPRLALAESLVTVASSGLVGERQTELLDLFDDPRAIARRSRQLARSAAGKGWSEPSDDDIIADEALERELAYRDL